MFEPRALMFTKEALVLVLILSLPPIIVAAVIGLLVSFVQALTQLQEQTFTFAVKLVSVTVTIAATAAWLGGEMFLFAERIFSSFPALTSY